MAKRGRGITDDAGRMSLTRVRRGKGRETKEDAETSEGVCLKVGGYVCVGALKEKERRKFGQEGDSLVPKGSERQRSSLLSFPKFEID